MTQAIECRRYGRTHAVLRPCQSSVIFILYEYFVQKNSERVLRRSRLYDNFIIAAK